MNIINLKECVTVPALALAMSVTRNVVERAIKAKTLPVYTLYSGGENTGFRLIYYLDIENWLFDRQGYYEPIKDGSTTFKYWTAKKNPQTIIARAISITTTNR